jgi:type II secretory pathway pseudopilin PulG
MSRLVSQRGDSVIEVLLAITIFSMVSIGSMTIMNQGTNTSQRALEITLVRQQIDAQAEAIRASQQAATTLIPEAVATWESIALPADTTIHSGTSCPATAPAGSFLMDGNRATKMGGAWFSNVDAAGAPPYARVIYDGSGVAQTSYGMWIERDYEAGVGGIKDAYSFGINACWNGAGTSDIPQRLRTVVRLYDPS